METSESTLINQSLTTAYNYIQTGRSEKAIPLLGIAQKFSKSPLVADLLSLSKGLSDAGLQKRLADEFGVVWCGENLDGKTIEVFCDQGMGDIIQMLRYIYMMKTRWPSCYVVLCCYAYYDAMAHLIAEIDYVDSFVPCHETCDYFVNFFSLPTILSDIKVPFQYPAHFKEVMKSPIPHQPTLIVKRRRVKSVGVAWRSNPNNELAVIKTIPDEIIRGLASDRYELFSLDPSKCLDFMKPLVLANLHDTALQISALDCVVSVDTVVLHLAGAMKARTFGLIPDDCDPRWDGYGYGCEWYPSVTLIRQQGDWTKAVAEVKRCIEYLC